MPIFSFIFLRIFFFFEFFFHSFVTLIFFAFAIKMKKFKIAKLDVSWSVNILKSRASKNFHSLSSFKDSRKLKKNTHFCHERLFIYLSFAQENWEPFDFDSSYQILSSLWVGTKISQNITTFLYKTSNRQCYELQDTYAIFRRKTLSRILSKPAGQYLHRYANPSVCM